MANVLDPAVPRTRALLRRPPALGGSGRRDLLALLLLAVAAYVVAVRLDAFERFAAWSERHDRLNLDELVIAAMVAGAAISAYAWRRSGELARLTRRHEGTEQVLAETSERYRSLFDYHPHAVLSLDLAGRLVSVNAAVSEVTGHPTQRLADMAFPDLVVDRDLARVTEAFARVLDRVPQQLEADIVRRDGRHVSMRLTGLPIVVAGEVVGVYCLAEDVSRSKLLEQQIHHAREVAEEANAAKSVFLANVTHELRTPLTTVLGYAELLADTELSPLQRRFLETVHGSGFRLLRLVDDLLDFGRIEAGQVELDPMPFSLGALVGATVAPHADDARSRGLDLRWTLDPDLPTAVLGDPERVAQVLTNLVGNAVKFTESGWVRVTVRRGAGGSVELSVRDSGIGISQADQQTLFHSFTQADGTITRRYGGTGLGLAISSELVVLMGGTLSVRSTPGLGSSFSVRLPLPAAASAHPAHPAHASGPPYAVPSRPGTLRVVPGGSASDRAPGATGGPRPATH